MARAIPNGSKDPKNISLQELKHDVTDARIFWDGLIAKIEAIGDLQTPRIDVDSLHDLANLIQRVGIDLTRPAFGLTKAESDLVVNVVLTADSLQTAGHPVLEMFEPSAGDTNPFNGETITAASLADVPAEIVAILAKGVNDRSGKEKKMLRNWEATKLATPPTPTTP